MKDPEETRLIAAVWTVATNLDHTALRLWFGRFMDSLPLEIIELAHNADAHLHGHTVRGFILGTVMGRFSDTFQPGEPCPCVPLGKPGEPSLGKWGGALEIWLAMESMKRHGYVAFQWPEGNPIVGGLIDFQITAAGEAYRLSLRERMNSKSE